MKRVRWGWVAWLGLLAICAVHVETSERANVVYRAAAQRQLAPLHLAMHVELDQMMNALGRGHD